ncbi:MAG TPA: hypothetical protein VNA26_08325 [Chitinophagaceae bacterium]|nr:hypothetical protein [Chitinophagaceae bacterium]
MTLYIKSKNIKKIILFSVIIFCCFSCNKETDLKKDILPGNYQEMFDALKLKFNVSYNYIEMVNNYQTGNNGTITFSLADTSMTEVYRSNVTKDYFRLDSFQVYSSNFENLGRNKYDASKSKFINNAWKSISIVDGVRMVSFGTTANGSYYFYQYLLSE